MAKEIYTSIINYFNFKKNPQHIWLLLSVSIYIVMFVYASIHDKISSYGAAPFIGYLNVIATLVSFTCITKYINLFIQKHQSFFKKNIIKKRMLIALLIIAVMNLFWSAWVHIDTWGCTGLRCVVTVILPIFSTLLNAFLVFVYSLFLYIKIESYNKQLNSCR